MNKGNVSMNQVLSGISKQIDLNEQKKIQLKILQSIDFFCKKNNIKYFAAYGTLIGAVRHHGYIPWDDDVDVFMLREDYERFLSLYRDDILSVQKDATDKYPFLFSKVFDSRTIVYEKNMQSSLSGVYIDIFPLDFVPENDFERLKYVKKLTLLYNLINVKIRKRMQRHTFLKTFVSDIIYVLLKFVNVNFLKKIGRRLVKSCSEKKSNYVGCLAIWTYLKKEKYPLELFDDILYMEFEDISIPVPKRFHELLTLIYGDYMQLPPAEKRINSHGCKAFWK